MKYGVLLGALALGAAIATAAVAMPGDDYWDHQWSGNHDNYKDWQQYPDYRDWPQDQTYRSHLNDADKSYLDSAAQADRTEIQMAGLATSNSQSDTVKRYATMLVNDHTSHLRHLDWIAGYLHYTIAPGISSDEQSDVTNLSGLQGQSFDNAFRTQMMTDHEAAIELNLTELRNGHNWWLKSYVLDSLPTFEAHLAMAQDQLPYTPPVLPSVSLLTPNTVITTPGSPTSTILTPNGATSTTIAPNGATSTTTTTPSGTTSTFTAPGGAMSTTTTPATNGTTSTSTTTNPVTGTQSTTTTITPNP